jgi:ABC-type amino acid transport substrate-binding protein
VEVPDLAGLDPDLATEILTASGLRLGRIAERANRNVPAGQVIRSVPPAGTLVDEGTAVRLIVSTGAPEPTVEPTPEPTAEPTRTPLPTEEPTPEPTLEPTPGPSEVPSAEPTSEPSPGVDGHLAAVQEAGVLRVNLVPDGSPWSTTNDQGEPAGFEAVVARRIARQLGVDVAFTSVPLDAVLDGSSIGEWDLALGRIPAIDPVTAAFLTTQPYAWDPLAVVVTADRAPAPEDLTGLAVCVVQGSAAQAWLEGAATLTDLDGIPVVAPAVVTLPVGTPTECADVLEAGAADAWIDGRPTVAAVTAERDGLVIEDRTLAVVPIAGVVETADSPDTSLVDAVDAAIGTLRDNGQLTRQSERSFGEDLSVGPPGLTLPGESPGIPDLSPEPSPIALIASGRS